MSRDPVTTRVLALAEPVCVAAGYELVDLRFTRDQGGWVLRVFIDRQRPEGAPPTDPGEIPEELVDLDDCERISRELSAVLDVEDPIPQAYALEVSSPGIDRPLRTAAHFRRFLGAEAKISMHVGVPVPGGADRKNFKGPLVAVEGDGDAAVVVIEIDGRQTFRLPLGDIDQARLVPDWDAVLKGGSGYRPRP
jgi:ribosome maturation factor RimP